MPRLPKMLTWHPTLERFIGPGPAGLVITVGWDLVNTEYQEAYQVWARPDRYGRRYWSTMRCWQEASRAALSIGRYQVRVWPPRKRPRKGPPLDIWLTHPANVPHLADVLPVLAAQWAADELPAAA